MIHEKIKDKIKKLEIKDKIKKFFSNPKEILSYAIPILIAVSLFIPVPYYITIGGGALDINDNIEVENAYEEKGSFNSAYVSEVNGNVLFYLLAKVIPSYEMSKVEDVIIGDEDVKDYEFRERLDFALSLNSATKMAYEYAKKELKIKETNLYVIYIDENAKTNIKVQDKILSVNNNKVNSFDDIKNVLNNYSVGDNVSIVVLRNNEKVVTNTTVFEIDNVKKLGIYLKTEYVYETKPKITFDFSDKESGPSGGLTIALSIYNKLVKEDITKGYKIVGTGTIEEDGSVGEIGGVKYKLIGAVKAKADIFIVPMGNYNEALSIIKDKEYNIKLIGVYNFEDALEKLKNL